MVKRNKKNILNSAQNLYYSRELVFNAFKSGFMNSENSKNSEPHVLILKLTNKLDLRIVEKVIALSNLSIYYTWKNIKSSYHNNEFKISAPTWNDIFELPDGFYSVSDIQYYFEYI